MNVDGKEASQKCRVIIGRGFSRLRENHSITQTRGYLTGSKREGERESLVIYRRGNDHRPGSEDTNRPFSKSVPSFCPRKSDGARERERERGVALPPRLPSPTNPPIIINGSRT